MTCAACSTACEKAIRRTPKVLEATVNLATSNATVIAEEDIDEESVLQAIRHAGFEGTVIQDDGVVLDDENRYHMAGLILCLSFALVLLYIGMAHMFPVKLWLPDFIAPEISPVAFAVAQLVLTIGIIIIARGFFVSGFSNILKRHPNMDSLVAVGTTSAFIYSVYYVWRIISGDVHAVHSLYFESAGVVLALVTLGKFLEERSKNSAKKAISSLASMIPGTATVIRDGEERKIDAKDVQLDDIVVVKPSERVPVDGVVVEGEASVDESMLTGESLPVYKENGFKVSGGTICKDGLLMVRATGIGNNTAIAQVLKLVTQAQERKAPVARLADKISGVFVPAVVVVAVLAAVLWTIAGKPSAFILQVFVSVLVIACPCALGLATPIAVITGSGRAANLGILYRGGDIIEKTAQVNTVLFDKTGTITEGKLKIADILPLPQNIADERTAAFLNNRFSSLESLKNGTPITQETLLFLAASAEYGSVHPIAEAIITHAQQSGMQLDKPKSAKTYPGKGITAEFEDFSVTAGTMRLIELQEIQYQHLPEIPQGCTGIYVALGKTLIGLIALSDTIREKVPEVIRSLESLHIETAMITGDNQGAADLIARKAGIGRVMAQVLPQDKEKEVRRLKSEGKVVAMVGDGINDAPSLAAADVGIAVYGGTDVAAEAAGVLLMRDDIHMVVDAFKLSRKVMRIIKENLFWAFIYNSVGIPIAAGLLYLFGGPLMSPLFAGAAMALSSVSVVLNSLRLTRYRPQK